MVPDLSKFTFDEVKNNSDNQNNVKCNHLMFSDDYLRLVLMRCCSTCNIGTMYN